MKSAGFAAIVAATAITGYAAYEKSLGRVLVCRELIVLCDCLRRDFMYKSTPVAELICDIINSNGLKRLSFVNVNCITDGENINSPLGDAVDRELNGFFHSLGRSDTATQLDLIAGFREYIAEKEEYFKTHHAKNSKLYLAFGLFSGVVTGLFFV